MKKVVELKAGKKFKIPKGYKIGRIAIKNKDGSESILEKKNHSIERDDELIEIIEKILHERRLK